MTTADRLNLQRAVHRFSTEVYARSEAYDPRDTEDWRSMAIGFLLGAGAPLPMDKDEDDPQMRITVEGYEILSAMVMDDVATALAIIEALP